VLAKIGSGRMMLADNPTRPAILLQMAKERYIVAGFYFLPRPRKKGSVPSPLSPISEFPRDWAKFFRFSIELATSFLLLIVIFHGIAEKGDRTCVENRKMAIGSVARYNGRRLVARRNLVCSAPSQEAGGSSR